MKELKELYMSIQLDDDIQKKIENISNALNENLTSKLSGKSRGNSNGRDSKPHIQKKLEIWDHFHQVISKLSKCKTHKELIEKIPKALKSLISFDKMSIILVNKGFETSLGITENGGKFDGDVKLQSVFYSNGWIKVITSSQFGCSNPQFQSLGQLSIGQRRYCI